VTDSLVLNFLL